MLKVQSETHRSMSACQAHHQIMWLLILVINTSSGLTFLSGSGVLRILRVLRALRSLKRWVTYLFPGEELFPHVGLEETVYFGNNASIIFEENWPIDTGKVSWPSGVVCSIQWMNGLP